MADSSVAANLLKPLDVHRDLSAQITFHYLGVSDDCGQLLYLVICQILYPGIRIYACLRKDAVGACSADSVDVSETDLNAFFSW